MARPSPKQTLLSVCCSGERSEAARPEAPHVRARVFFLTSLSMHAPWRIAAIRTEPAGRLLDSLRGHFVGPDAHQVRHRRDPRAGVPRRSAAPAVHFGRMATAYAAAFACARIPSLSEPNPPFLDAVESYATAGRHTARFARVGSERWCQTRPLKHQPPKPHCGLCVYPLHVCLLRTSLSGMAQ